MSDPLPPARILVLADAVKAAVNAAAFTGAPLAVRVYSPNYDTAATTALQLVVVPGPDRSAEPMSRTEWTDSCNVHVAVYKKIDSGSSNGATESFNAKADVALALAEQIYDLFSPGETIGGYSLRSVQHSPVFIPQYVRENGTIVSVVALQFDLP